MFDRYVRFIFLYEFAERLYEICIPFGRMGIQLF